MADWKSFVIEVPGKDLLEPVRNVLETLLIFLDVLQTILDTIKVFLVDFGNPLRALVEALIRLIEELFLALKATGAQALFHVPDPFNDPNFDLNRGYDAFPNVFKASLFDAKDFNRPQPRPGSTRGGFVLLMIQADSVVGLIARLNQLLRFFSKELTAPRYEAPNNFKVSPVGSSGDPLLSVASVFAEAPIKSVSLTWTLPTTAETPDPGFTDLVSRVANEFIPAKYLIEKSVEINPSAELIDIADIKSPTSAGEVEFTRAVPTAGGDVVNKKERLRDTYEEPVVKFTEYIVLDETAVTSLLGQLGTFRYIDSDVAANKTYYYRVRAFSGDLDMAGTQINWGDPEYAGSREVKHVVWPSAGGDPEDTVVPGKPTGIVSVRIPSAIPDFDVVENLNRVFQASFSLDFHRQLLQGSDPNLPSNIGKSSLTKQASAIADLGFSSLVAEINSVSEGRGVAEALTLLPDLDFPWEERAVRKQAARLADAVASAMMETGSDPLESFRSLMQTNQSLLGSSSLKEAVFSLTELEGTDVEKATILIQASTDSAFRTALLDVINLLKSFTLGGAPPDWISFNPLRDIIPWSGQLLYQLLDTVQALVDAFNGVISEINNFIDLLQQKIATLERTLEFLISILDFIESLQFGAYILNVPEIDGSATDWAREVDTAQGTIPNTGPEGYSGGVALAYVGADITAFKTAFQIIFGI